MCSSLLFMALLLSGANDRIDHAPVCAQFAQDYVPAQFEFRRPAGPRPGPEWWASEASVTVKAGLRDGRLVVESDRSPAETKALLIEAIALETPLTKD